MTPPSTLEKQRPAPERAVNPMPGKRKRCRPVHLHDTSSKRIKTCSPAATITHPTLSLYYPRILTLRHYILSQLPATSKTRRRKFTNLSHEATETSGGNGDTEDEASTMLAKLLDRTLICRKANEHRVPFETREQGFRTFSQRNDAVDESSLLEGNTPQSDVGLPKPYLLFYPLFILFLYIRLLYIASYFDAWAWLKAV